MYFSYENISNHSQSSAIASAHRILSEGWERRGYKNIPLTEDIPWALENPSQRSLNFYLHSWDMVDNLLKAYNATKDQIFFSPALKVVVGWIEKHDIDNPPSSMSSFAWYDMAVGLRAYRLAYIIDAGQHENLFDQEIKDKLWASLLQHHAYLSDDGNIAFHNNHGYYQVAGQLAMGRRFASVSTDMAQSLQQGHTRIHHMLRQQFADDGVHREHSPDYHCMVYDTLKALIDSGLIDDPEIVDFSYKIEEALSWFILPNRHIANFGDSDFRSLIRKAHEAARKWATPAMQYLITNGKIGSAPTEIFRTFDKGGYFVVRKPSAAAPGKPDQSSYLAQTAAFHSRTHKHADDLSFIWSDRGQDILVDAGRYGYIGKTEQGSDLWRNGYWYADPNRIYCESTRAHNTLEFNGSDYPRKGIMPYGSAIKRRLLHDSGIIVMETENKPFKSIRHARVLIFMPAEWLIVFDWFHDNNDSLHDVRQWFHIAPHLRALYEDGGYRIPFPGEREPSLCIQPLLSGQKSSKLFLGEEGENIQGWWSPKERDILPNYAFHYEFLQKKSESFATIFNFSEKIEKDLSWSKANISGRKAQFRWRDDRGRHDIFLERPAEGDLSLSYQSGR